MKITRTLIHNAGNRVQRYKVSQEEVLDVIPAGYAGEFRGDSWREECNLVFQYTPADMISNWGFPHEEEQYGTNKFSAIGGRCWVYSFKCAMADGGEIKFVMYSCELKGAINGDGGGHSSVFFLKDNEGNFPYQNRVREVLDTLHHMHPNSVEEPYRRIEL